MDPISLYCSVLDGNPEFVKFSLLSLFQLHLDECRLILVLRKDYVVPLVGELFQLYFMCIFKGNYFPPLKQSVMIRLEIKRTYMFGKYFLLALLLLKYAELFQPFPCLCSLIQFALSLTIFPVFIQ